jgi:hypothetical protein
MYRMEVSDEKTEQSCLGRNTGSVCNLSCSYYNVRSNKGHKELFTYPAKSAVEKRRERVKKKLHIGAGTLYCYYLGVCTIRFRKLFDV